MSIPRFFQRVHAAVGRHLLVDSVTLATRLQSVTVGVECASPADRGASWTCELLVNQLARLYPSICLFGNEAAVDAMRALARSINPAVELSEDRFAATVSITTCATVKSASPLVTGRGWIACFGGDVPAGPDPEPNPFACGAAAALAAGFLFRKLLLGDDAGTTSTARVDLLSFGAESRGDTLPLPDGRLDLGRIAIAGVGAVGNAAIWALSRCPQLAGHAYIVEPEAIELSNLQRYVLALDADVGIEKTALAQRALASTSLVLDVRKSRLGDLALPRDLDRVLVTIDNKEGRRIAQALLPRLVVNGWTSESGLGASWHDFRPEAACLACLYQPTGPAPSQTELVARALGLDPTRAALLWITPEVVGQGDADVIAHNLGGEPSELNPWIGKSLQELYTNLVCGSVALGVGMRGRVEVVPLAHQSVLAGILAAAELVKRSDPGLRAASPKQNLVAWHDVTRAPPRVWLQHRVRELGCICSDADYIAEYEAKWGIQSS